jgi:hypothetical protein
MQKTTNKEKVLRKINYSLNIRVLHYTRVKVKVKVTPTTGRKGPRGFRVG